MLCNILQSSVKCRLVWIRREICTDQVPLKVKNRPKTILNKYVGRFWCERTTWDGLFDCDIIIDIDLYFDQKWQFEVKTLIVLFLFFITNMLLFTSQDFKSCHVNYLWCFICCFSVWRHPFTVEETFLQIISIEETNSSTYWVAWGWACFQQMFIFGWTEV